MAGGWNKGLKTGYAPWRGKKRGPHSAETKAKMRMAALGKPKSAEHRANIAAARRGVSHMSTEAVERMRQTKLAQHLHMGEEEKAKLSKRWKGRGNPGWAKPTDHGPRTHWAEYAGVKLRSTWEIRLAKALDGKKLKWQYEPERFDLGWCTYLPDFYVPAMKSYVEVKGYFDPKSKDKVAAFRKQYPHLSLIVATDRVLKLFER